MAVFVPFEAAAGSDFEFYRFGVYHAVKTRGDETRCPNEVGQIIYGKCNAYCSRTIEHAAGSQDTRQQACSSSRSVPAIIWHVSHPRVGAYLIDRLHAGCAVSLCQWRLVNRLGGLGAITGRAPRTAYSLWFHSAAAWRCAGRWNR